MYFGFTHQLQNRVGNGMSFQRCTQDTPVPKAKMFSYGEMMSRCDSLHVPNGEEVPMGSEYEMSYLGRENLFTCPDGTVLNINTGKTVRNANNFSYDRHCWGNGMMDNPFERNTGTWDDMQIHSFNPHTSRENPNEYCMSQQDVEYQRYSEMKNKEIMDNMSEEQKRLLRGLEDGRFSSKSRLIEESRIC